jgi:N-acetylmuramoyl-L-alanine amidase
MGGRFYCGAVAFGLAGTLALTALPQAPLQTTASNPPVAAPRFVVVLDAAHGGDEVGGQVGASGSAVAEKTLTLALSVRLRSLLAARGFTVVTTREGNVNLTGDARAQIANHATSGPGDSACLSLHASEAGSGVHIYVSSLAPTQPTRFPAWKTAQSAYVTRSLKLAGTVNSALEHTSPRGESESAAGNSNGGAIPATLAQASLPGLDSLTCPAVAIEVAPIRTSDRSVATEVTDPQYQTQLVEALAAAMLEWKTDWETESGRLTSPSGGGLPK